MHRPLAMIRQKEINMKKNLISTIFASLSIFGFAQDLHYTGNIYALTEPSVVVSKPKSEISIDSSSMERVYNLVDNDWNSYNVVKIGRQYWMAENLKTTKLNDGTKIPVISDYKLWSSLISPGYCLYNNNAEKYKNEYGVLYNGYTVSTGKLCPVGWHIPSNEEWKTLTNYCGEDKAGGYLKGKNNWMSPNTGATNTTGFAALPGGSRGNLGSFMDIGIRGHWWSSTENDNSDVWNRTMSFSNNDVTGSSDHKKSGLSVRCIKDY
jgi:uncharacterized protein (TIGR02145 family)